MPTQSTLSDFKVTLATAVIAAAGHRKQSRVVEWIRAPGAQDASYELLAHCPTGLETLDRKLAKALEKIIKGELHTELLTLQKRQLEHGTAMVTGRQILYLLYRFLATDPSMKPMYDMSDLTHLVHRYPKGEHDRAWNEWETRVNSFKDGGISEPQLMNCLLTYLRDVPFMKEIIDTLRMRGANHPDYNYGLLRE